MVGEMQIRLRDKCECGKVTAPSEAVARELFEHVSEFNRSHQSVRFYVCQFGNHHWTRQYAEEEHKDV